MAQWVWVEAVAWAESRWLTGSISIRQLVADLDALQEAMRLEPGAPSAELARLRSDLDALVDLHGLDLHHSEDLIEVDKVLRRCGELVWRVH